MGDIISALSVPIVAAVVIIGAILMWGFFAAQDTTAVWRDIAVGFGGSSFPTSTATATVPGYLFPTSTLDAASGTPAAISSINIMNEYPEKLVYTLETGSDPAPYAAHCAERAGRFNACGSPCAPGRESCVAVCAYTCEGAF